jgi:pimeloyl-ACP methyl ester carboxylesterase
MPFAVNQGIRIHYESEGAGDPLILHHGISHCGAAWREDGYVEPLKKHYQMILLDARGHAASDKPLESSCYAAESLVGDVVAVLDSLQITRAHFWGYSLGAIAGLSMLKYAPSYLRSLIAGGYSPYGISTKEEAQGNPEFRTGLLFAIEHGMGALMALYEKRSGQPLPPHLRARYESNDPRALLACFDGTVSWCGVGEVLKSSMTPCLLYAGDLDPMHGSARAASQELPNATFVSLPGLDHTQTMFAAGLMLPHAESFLTTVSRQTA